MKYTILTALIIVSVASFCVAECPLDHLKIGINADGIWGTADDNVLFVNSTQKYRHSDPSNSGSATWLNWYYPMYYNERFSRYQRGEPGFDLIADGSLFQIPGTAGQDHQIIIKCTSITPGFSARNSSLGILIDQAGDQIEHYSLSEPHLHLEYRAPSPLDQLYWITFVIYDQLQNYLPSNPVSIAFAFEPVAGDLDIDEKVDILDIAEFGRYWLENDSGYSNDFYERADINTDGKVDFSDFNILASNWQ